MEVLFIILAIGIVAVSIWAIVDVLRRPKTTFQQISQNKLLWVILLVVALVACWPRGAGAVDLLPGRRAPDARRGLSDRHADHAQVGAVAVTSHP